MGSFYNYGLERLFRKNPAGEISKTGAMHRGGIFCVPPPIPFTEVFQIFEERQGIPLFYKIFFYKNYATFGCGEGVGSSDQIFL